MALGTQEKAVYLKAFEGKLYRSSDKENKEGFTYIRGHIVGLDLVPRTYENRDYRALQITISDGDTYKLEVNESTKNYRNLIGFFRNSDLSKEIQINATLDKGKDGDKKNTSLTVTDQNDSGGKWVSSYFKKDTETELPPLLEITHPKTGKHISWDGTDQLELLEKVLNEDLKPQLKAAPTTKVAPQQAQDSTDEAEPEYDGGEDPDDLPF